MAANELPSFQELLSLDVTKHVEKKGRFSYLSWTHAVTQLKLHFPNARWEYLTNHAGEYTHKCPDGSYMIVVNLSLTGDMGYQSLPMPILDYNNKPIMGPNCFETNTAMMRGLAKIISIETGIGLHIFNGEDLPPEGSKPASKAPPTPPPVKPPQKRSGGPGSAPVTITEEQSSREHVKQIMTDPAANIDPIALDKPEPMIELSDPKVKAFVTGYKPKVGTDRWNDLKKEAGIDFRKKQIPVSQFERLQDLVAEELGEGPKLDDQPTPF